MVINILKAKEICMKISENIEMVINSDEKLKIRVVQENYRVYKNNLEHSDLLDFKFGLEIIGLEEIYTSNDLVYSMDIFDISIEELEDISAKTELGNECLGVLKWLYKLENEDSYRITIDSELEEVKQELQDAISTRIDLKAYI